MVSAGLARGAGPDESTHAELLLELGVDPVHL